MNDDDNDHVRGFCDGMQDAERGCLLACMFLGGTLVILTAIFWLFYL